MFSVSARKPVIPRTNWTLWLLHLGLFITFEASTSIRFFLYRKREFCPLWLTSIWKHWKQIKNPTLILFGFHLEVSWSQVKSKFRKSAISPSLVKSRNIQSGLRQIPNLAHICIQDWKNMKITISKIGST